MMMMMRELSEFAFGCIKNRISFCQSSAVLQDLFGFRAVFKL